MCVDYGSTSGKQAHRKIDDGCPHHTRIAIETNMNVQREI